MRRRLWHALRIVDAHASNDRGSDPVIPESEYTTRLPLNINDADISPDSTHPPEERQGMTEMTLCLMLQSSTKHFNRLSFVPRSSYERPPLPIESDWNLRQHEIEVWRQTLEEKFMLHCDETIPMQWFLKQLGRSITLLAQLIAIRPMQRHPAAKPPHVDSSFVLKAAIELLEESRKLYLQPSVRQWDWYIWVQWHPLAVALAELCSYTEGPLVEQAWQSVEVTYDRYVDLVADSRRGMLWRPIEKLYKKAKANRAARLSTADVAKKDTSHSQPFDFQSVPHVSGVGSLKPTEQSSQMGEMNSLQHLSVNDTPQSWESEMLEPVDMAWLDWASFAEDVTDFNMIDPINLMETSWS